MASIRLILVLTVLASWTGCEERKLPTPPPADVTVAIDAGATAQADVAPPGPKIIKDDGPMPGPDTAVATAGDFKVTVADFEESSRVSLLFAPDGQTEIGPERLAIPHVHVTMARSLLSQKVIAAELEKRGIRPTTEQLNAYLREHQRLRRFGQHIDDSEALAAALKPLGLEPAQLLKVAWAELGNQMLARAMLADIADAEIWIAYEAQNTTRTAALISGRNVPTSKEIDGWMGKHADEIDEHFEANQRKYRTPRRVKLNIVKPAPGSNVGEPTLKEAAALLGKGVQPVTVAKDLALKSQLGAQLVRGENKRAFAMKPGEVGWTSAGPRGAYAWKVVGFEESRLPEMSRPLRREIAAELLRTTAVVPSLAAKLERAAKILLKPKFDAHSAEMIQADPRLTQPLRKKIEAIEGLEFQVSTFPNNPNAPLPKHGLAEEVITTSFALEGRDPSPAFMSRERGFVVRVLARSDASRKAFEANIDENRKAFLAAMEPRIVGQWVESRMRELDAKVDVKPLRIKFGVLQKE